MKFYSGNKGRLQSLMALAVCVGMLPSLWFPMAAAPRRLLSDQERASTPARITSVSATVTSNGVTLDWRSNLDPDNLGFNVYRITADSRVRVNREIIPGAVFILNSKTTELAPRTYSWTDRGGRAGSTYYIEWVSVSGAAQFITQLVTVKQAGATVFQETLEQAQAQNSDAAQISFPAAEKSVGPAPSGTIENQWTIASKPGLKISIKRDGWYRVTQAEMAAAGFNPAVDIRNLRLFNDGQELAISTNQSMGTFGSSDFIEFYGRGLDTPTTDTRIYYLIADTVRGKRVGGGNRPDGEPAEQLPAAPVAARATLSRPSPFGLVWTFLDLPQRTLSVTETIRGVSEPITRAEPKLRPRENAGDPSSLAERADDLSNVVEEKPTADGVKSVAVPLIPKNKEPGSFVGEAAPPAISAPAKPAARKKGNAKRSRRRKSQARRYNHAEIVSAVSPADFDYTVQLKERFLYFVGALNGDTENFFGRVISSLVVNETLATPNPDLNAPGPAKLEIALQGVSPVPHQVNILFNNTAVGLMDYSGQQHSVQTFDVPVSLLQNGANTVTFSPVAGGLVSLVDYARITYRHSYRADSDSLKFNLRGTQSLNVDGFSSPKVRLIDYTDPFSVIVTKPLAQPGNSGYSVTIPTSTSRKKDQRLLYAIINGTFQQAAGLSLNQPSTIKSGNLSQTITNGADFLIIAHKSLISSMSPLVTARQNQGFTVGVVDVEDVYDEFGYGLHGPQAIKDFLAYAASHWLTKPHYLIFAGDATYDPRNYTGSGDFDLVPTKLVDATFNETASDDWLADFDDDGVANIAIGRLPARNPTDANLMISKIVNFTPVTPEAALLVADDPGTPAVWDFETASDDVQALLPLSMSVQRVNVRTEPSAAAATSDIINGFTQGRAVVNYSGHGNVDVWSGASVFTSANAIALTNGTKLPFVIVMDCLNGYYHDPNLLSLSEAFLLAQNGGAVAVFASSGLTSTPGQRQMELQLYATLYGGQSIALGDAIKTAKAATTDIDVRRTWVYFGDPSLKIR